MCNRFEIHEASTSNIRSQHSVQLRIYHYYEANQQKMSLYTVTVQNVLYVLHLLMYLFGQLLQHFMPFCPTLLHYSIVNCYQ